MCCYICGVVMAIGSLFSKSVDYFLSSLKSKGAKVPKELDPKVPEDTHGRYRPNYSMLIALALASTVIPKEGGPVKNILESARSTKGMSEIRSGSKSRKGLQSHALGGGARSISALKFSDSPPDKAMRSFSSQKGFVQGTVENIKLGTAQPQGEKFVGVDIHPGTSRGKGATFSSSGIGAASPSSGIEASSGVSVETTPIGMGLSMEGGLASRDAAAVEISPSLFAPDKAAPGGLGLYRASASTAPGAVAPPVPKARKHFTALLGAIPPASSGVVAPLTMSFEESSSIDLPMPPMLSKLTGAGKIASEKAGYGSLLSAPPLLETNLDFGTSASLGYVMVDLPVTFSPVTPKWELPDFSGVPTARILTDLNREPLAFDYALPATPKLDVSTIIPYAGKLLTPTIPNLLLSGLGSVGLIPSVGPGAQGVTKQVDDLKLRFMSTARNMVEALQSIPSTLTAHQDFLSDWYAGKLSRDVPGTVAPSLKDLEARAPSTASDTMTSFMPPDVQALMKGIAEGSVPVKLAERGSASTLGSTASATTASFSPDQRVYGPVVLRAQGYDDQAILNANFPADELALAGFSPQDLQDAGYTFQEVLRAHFDAVDLEAAGFEPNALLAVGYTEDQLLTAGYMQDEVTRAIGEVATLAAEDFANLDTFDTADLQALALQHFSSMDPANFSDNQLRDFLKIRLGKLAEPIGGVVASTPSTAAALSTFSNHELENLQKGLNANMSSEEPVSKDRRAGYYKAIVDGNRAEAREILADIESNFGTAQAAHLLNTQILTKARNLPEGERAGYLQKMYEEEYLASETSDTLGNTIMHHVRTILGDAAGDELFTMWDASHPATQATVTTPTAAAIGNPTVEDEMATLFLNESDKLKAFHSSVSSDVFESLSTFDEAYGNALNHRDKDGARQILKMVEDDSDLGPEMASYLLNYHLLSNAARLPAEKRTNFLQKAYEEEYLAPETSHVVAEKIMGNVRTVLGDEAGDNLFTAWKATQPPTLKEELFAKWDAAKAAKSMTPAVESMDELEAQFNAAYPSVPVLSSSVIEELLVGSTDATGGRLPSAALLSKLTDVEKENLGPRAAPTSTVKPNVEPDQQAEPLAKKRPLKSHVDKDPSEDIS